MKRNVRWVDSGSGMHGGDCHDFVNEALGGVCNALHSSAKA